MQPIRIWGRPEKQLRKHANARAPYEAWERIARAAEWRRFADIRRHRLDVDRIGECYVFNIGGNKFRLVTNIMFANDVEEGTVLITDLLTHAEYDKGGWKSDC